MSYEISYRRQAFLLPTAQTGHYDDALFLLEECGSNNCYEIGNRRRSRSWSCLAAGGRSDCLAEVTRCAASCCGGSLILCGRRNTTPEGYIKAWRKAIKEAVAFDKAHEHGFYIQIFTRINDEDARKDRLYAFERLTKQTAVVPRRGKDEHRGVEYTEWRFNAGVPEQAKLWLETKTGGRGFRCVDVTGPDR